eukprot:CAMPEP_0183729956 /NCGR_PEP_ID=MMETSP0737-20130205/31603_1 /TAXON_ID=385413 /ORGANISM="Thalassiosira miniscula, Strain CCMP1093" /LENGTH=612 /DNA_ID=CAMNT_0025962291 /DNA_START=35 /DNA_END=1870 /DNA_ORIENTATION=-
MSDLHDLDESRRHGVPITPPRPTQPASPPLQLSTLEETQSLGSNEGQTMNGWHSQLQYQHQQHQQQQNHLQPTHAPRHSQQNNARLAAERIPHHNLSSTEATKDLDGEMSGLQAAAAKTALLIHGKANRSSLEGGVITMEEGEDGDDKSSHWIFHRHVGFSIKDLQHEHIIDNNLNNAIANKNLPSQQWDHQTEKNNLLQQLRTLRRQRQHYQKCNNTQQSHSNEWDFRLSSAQQYHQNALSSLEAATSKRIWLQEECQRARKCHVLGDVFFIWHRGPFGTINGFRLGKSVTTMVGLVKKCAANSNTTANGGGTSSGGTNGSTGGMGGGQAAGSGSGGATGTSFFSWGASETPIVNTNGNSNVTKTKDATAEKIMVPWNEINSALGQIVFLLSTLQNAPYGRIVFRRHVLQPCGSASKIGFLKKNISSTQQQRQQQNPKNYSERRSITALAAYYNTGTNTANHTTMASKPTQQIAKTATTATSQHLPTSQLLPGDVTWYNLHHYEENGSLLSMGYYARRNFNMALDGLLYCIAEACLVVEGRDMALAPPYVMRVDGLVVGKDVHHGTGHQGVVGGPNKDGGVPTVGGLPLAYDPAAGERWTMVCKYLLTNLK